MGTMRNVLGSIAACLLIIAITGPEAHAGQGGYGVVGASCVADPSSNGLYAQVNGGITFAPGQTGTIVLHCSLSNADEMITPDRIKVLYTDDTTVSGNGVKVVLFKMSKSSVTIFTIGAVDSSATPGCSQSGTS